MIDNVRCLKPLRRDGYSSSIELQDSQPTGRVLVAGGVWDDVTDLADAYLAEHDPTPITAEWLEAVGFKAVPSDMGPKYDDHYERELLNLWNFNDKCWLINGLDTFELKTRGQVRLLCRAVGIPLTESRNP